MKKHLISLMFASMMLIPSIVLAAPVPATYDSTGWSDYLEKGKTSKIPDGVPTGPGAVSGYYGSGFWPDGYIQITNPIDMSNDNGILLAESARVNGRYYASETMKAFLDAVGVQMRKLSKREDIKIPVQELFFTPGAVPMRVLADQTTTISFGVYIMNGAVSEPVTDVRIHGEVVSKGAAFLLTSKTRTAQRYHHYQKTANSFRSKFPQMSYTEFHATTQEIFKIANEQLAALGSGAKDKEAAQIVQEKDEADKLNTEREVTKGQIVEKYEKELDALRDKLILDLTRKERDEVVEKIRAIEKQKQSEIQALNTNSKTGNNINIQEVIEEVRTGRRLTAAQRKLRYDTAAIRHPDDLVLDDVSMWNLIESMLSQKAVEVTEIRLPELMKKRLIEYAKKNKKNAKIITAFDTLTVATTYTFEVSLSCSTRDRFLGCQLGGSPDIEKRITKAASALLKGMSELAKPRQMEIIQLVVNANPVELEYTFDTTELRNFFSEHYDYNERMRYMNLLTTLENMTIKGESSATRSRRLSKLRGTENDSSFENYFEDYFNEFSLH